MGDIDSSREPYGELDILSHVCKNPSSDDVSARRLGGDKYDVCNLSEIQTVKADGLLDGQRDRQRDGCVTGKPRKMC